MLVLLLGKDKRRENTSFDFLEKKSEVWGVGESLMMTVGWRLVI